MNKERYATLSKCLVLMEGILRSFAQNETICTAKPGFEKAFKETENDCAVIREMLIEARYQD